jgi:peptidoglycan/xylan/chitin deacetylase (PgdA/CDA1 family)/ubiquinone/menaquinone biosynthesis C-methylase UbiE
VPEVSVIVPAFNRAETIAATLDSLVAQTFEDWEAIIVDDGSTDSTAEVVGAYASGDQRIRLLTQANAGVSAARNVGIEASRGRWVFFLDADDWVTPEALALLVRAVEHDPERAVAIGRSVLVMPNGAEVVEPEPPPSNEMFVEMARRCVYSIHTAIQPTELVRAVGGFDTSLIAGEDWDLWQRIARTGPTYVYLPEKIAYYRVRRASASRAPLRLLLDGHKVIERGHSVDPRLDTWPGPLHPPPDPEGVASAMLYLSAYCAGLAIGAGEDPSYLLDHVPSISSQDADGRWLAETLFESVAGGLCETVSAWPRFPPEVHRGAAAYIDGLAERGKDRLLPVTTARAFEALLAQQMLRDSDASTVTVGATQVVRADLGTPIADIPTAPDVERLVLELRNDDGFAGVVTDARESAQALVDALEDDSVLATAMLPSVGPSVPALVAADALTEEIAWDLMGLLLDETVRASLDLARSGDAFVVQRGELELGSCVVRAEVPTPELVLEAAGWVLFMQELWGLPELGGQGFYQDVQVGPDAGAPVVAAEAGTLVEVEVAEQLPLITTEAESAVVQVNLAGLPLMALRIPARDGAVTPHRIRRAINLEGKFELCRVVVREAVMQSRWPAGTPLRSRLAELAARRRQAAAVTPSSEAGELGARRRALLEEFVPAGHRAVVFGRRPTRHLSGAACRPVALPRESRSLMEQSASRSGQIVAEHGDAQLPQVCLYLPYLFDAQETARDLDPDIDARAADFEEIFEEEDPWEYTSAYEQRKYRETLALLPRHIGSALEVGCAEGVFTRMLAGRADRVTAVDISPTAIARARARCADLNNAEFKQLDLFASEPGELQDLEGAFDVVVCAEVLYYAPDRDVLRLALQRLIKALKPGGSLIVVHADLVVDEPDQPGFDWDHLIGAAGIERELAALEELSLQGERRSVYYRAQRWRRGAEQRWRVIHRGPRRRTLRDVPAPEPSGARTFLPHGGEVNRTSDLEVTGELAVLMYHRIAPETPAAGRRWATTPWEFEEQLAWLCDQKYESVSLDEWAVACANDVVLPGRRVLITFDDGLQDFADHALPLLMAYGFRADMHIVTGHVGGGNVWEGPDFPRYPLMDWQTILDLPRHTVTLGSHTVNHVAFAALDPVTATEEMLRSKCELEDRLGRPVTRIAYPYGSMDDSTWRLAVAAGYDYAYTTDEWLAERDRNLLRIPRLEMRGGMAIEQFAQLVRTGQLRSTTEVDRIDEAVPSVETVSQTVLEGA